MNMNQEQNNMENLSIYNEKIPKPKKPWYKKRWLWVALIVVLIILINSISSCAKNFSESLEPSVTFTMEESLGNRTENSTPLGIYDVEIIERSSGSYLTGKIKKNSSTPKQSYIILDVEFYDSKGKPVTSSNLDTGELNSDDKHLLSKDDIFEFEIDIFNEDATQFKIIKLEEVSLEERNAEHIKILLSNATYALENENLEGARSYLEKALEIDPNNKDALELYKKLEEAEKAIGEKVDATINVKYSENLVFSKYGLEIEINGKEIGTIEQGEENAFKESLSMGENTIKFIQSDKSTNYKEVSFDVTENGDYYFYCSAYKDKITCSFTTDGFNSSVNIESSNAEESSKENNANVPNGYSLLTEDDFCDNLKIYFYDESEGDNAKPEHCYTVLNFGTEGSPFGLYYYYVLDVAVNNKQWIKKELISNEPNEFDIEIYGGYLIKNDDAALKNPTKTARATEADNYEKALSYYVGQTLYTLNVTDEKMYSSWFVIEDGFLTYTVTDGDRIQEMSIDQLGAYYVEK